MDFTVGIFLNVLFAFFAKSFVSSGSIMIILTFLENILLILFHG